MGWSLSLTNAINATIFIKSKKYNEITYLYGNYVNAQEIKINMRHEIKHLEIPKKDAWTFFTESNITRLVFLQLLPP